MLVKFKSGNLEARLKMSAVPNKDDIISFSGVKYQITNIRWELDAGQEDQLVVVFLTPRMNEK